MCKFLCDELRGVKLTGILLFVVQVWLKLLSIQTSKNGVFIIFIWQGFWPVLWSFFTPQLSAAEYEQSFINVLPGF